MPNPNMPASPKLGAPVQGIPNNAGVGSSANADLSNMIGDLLGPGPGNELPSTSTPAPAPAAPVAPAPAPVPTPVARPVPVAPAAPRTEEPMIPDDVLAPVTPVPAMPAPEGDGDAEDAPESSDPKANAAWAAVKKDRRELREKLKSAEAEAERLRTNQTPDLTEVLALKAQMAEYETRLGRHDLASTKAFKAKFDNPMAAIQQRSVSMLVRSGREPDAAKALVSKLFAASGEELQNILSDEPTMLQGALMTAVGEYSDIAKTREDAIGHWKESKAALETVGAREQQISLAENIEKDTRTAVEQALRAGNFLYGRSTTNQKWNEGVDQRINAVKGILRTSKSADLVQWVLEGVTAKQTRDFLALEQQAHAKTRAERDGLLGAAPRVGGAGDGRNRPSTAGAKPRSPNEVISGLLADAPHRAFR